MADEYQVSVLSRAGDDVEHIFRWLEERSPSGAVRWYSEFLRAAESLKIEPERFGLAPEHVGLDLPLRQHFFQNSGRSSLPNHLPHC